MCCVERVSILCLHKRRQIVLTSVLGHYDIASCSESLIWVLLKIIANWPHMLTSSKAINGKHYHLGLEPNVTVIGINLWKMWLNSYLILCHGMAWLLLVEHNINLNHKTRFTNPTACITLSAKSNSNRPHYDLTYVNPSYFIYPIMTRSNRWS